MTAIRKINKEYIDAHRSSWRDAVKVQPVVIEKLHINKFKGKNKIVIQTVEGPFEINKDDYLTALKNNSQDNTLYILYNVNIEGRKVSKRFNKQNGTNAKVLDRWVVRGEDLKNLGYKAYKFGTYRKSANSAVKVFIAKEPLEVLVPWSESPLRGKVGDVVVIHGDGNYNIIDRKTFEENYEVLRKVN